MIGFFSTHTHKLKKLHVYLMRDEKEKEYSGVYMILVVQTANFLVCWWLLTFLILRIEKEKSCWVYIGSG